LLQDINCNVYWFKGATEAPAKLGFMLTKSSFAVSKSSRIFCLRRLQNNKINVHLISKLRLISLSIVFRQGITNMVACLAQDRF